LAGLLSGVAAPAFAAEAPGEAQLVTAASAERSGAYSFASSRLSANYGRLRPFYGRLRPFEISTFWSGTAAFGSTDAEVVEFWGRLRPFWGRIRGFWEGTGDSVGLTARWGRIRGFWGEGDYASLYAGLDGAAKTDLLQAGLDAFVADARLFWDPMIRQQTAGGSDFDAFLVDFARRMEERHQLGFLADGRLDAGRIAGWDDEQRAKFIVEWYDGLMSFSGSDHVDHWMKTARWTPAITQQQGGGTDVRIGMLDSVVSGDADLRGKIAYVGTNGTFSDGHGAAVASLLVASHDGRGVMGVAPNAKIVANNPFDATGTASWEAVTQGVGLLASNGASVVNLSLGVPGYTLHPEWNKVLLATAKETASTVLVFAAGNDGIAQTGAIEWKAKNAFLVVGSVDATETISAFSNRPGSACLGRNGGCDEALADRFVVAPGELILVSDDRGGVIRHSGTSFSAPLVVGAVALLQDRWPWLKKHPGDTVDIILNSAKDLGAPGTDPVYGRGLLDIAAAQSPLSFDNLVYYEYDGGSKAPAKKRASQVLSAGLKEAAWEAGGVYFTAFEKLKNTHRDFAIPLSSKLVDQTVLMNGSRERFQHYLRSRFVDWLKTGSGFTDRMDLVAPVANRQGLNLTLRASVPEGGYRASFRAPDLGVRIASSSDRLAFSFGNGAGATALGAFGGFALSSDFDARQGGVNPVLGYASGDAYGSVELAVADGLRVTFGATQDERRVSALDLAARGDLALAGLDAYEASAVHARAVYAVGDALEVTAAVSRLREKGSLFGVQSLDRSDLADGTVSRSLTLGARLDAGSGFSLTASSSFVRSRSGANQALRVADEGLGGSAFQLVAEKQGVLGGGDRLRVSLSQPLFLDRGTLEYTQIKVVDRETGEIGPVTERFSIAGSTRPFIAEAIYGRPMMLGAGEFSAFGRAEQRSDSRGGDREYIAGARVSLGF